MIMAQEYEAGSTGIGQSRYTALPYSRDRTKDLAVITSFAVRAAGNGDMRQPDYLLVGEHNRDFSA